MAGTIARGPVGLAIGQVEVLRTQGTDNGVVHCLREVLAGRCAGLIPGVFLLIALANGIHALETRLQIGHLRPRLAQGSAGFAELLITHERPARRDNVVLGLELNHGAFSRRRLVAKILQPFLQPVAGAARRLVLCVHLVVDVGIDHLVGDPRGKFRIAAREVDPDHVALADTLRLDPARQDCDRTVDPIGL